MSVSFDIPAVHAVQVDRNTRTLREAILSILQTSPRLPLPGRGQTLTRWRTLDALAQADLVLAKLLEPHWDAQAIFADLQVDPAGAAGGTPVTCWAVWAAEPADAIVRGTRQSDGTLQLNGRKAWCSGAALVSHALITYIDENDRRGLAAIALDAPGVRITGDGWHGVGMDATASVDIVLTGVAATPVGPPGAYLSRAGFWQGGMGIAACWLGGATALARAARAQAARRPDAHALAHIGALDVALTTTQALMRETAAWVDAHPAADAQWPAFRLRAAAEACAQTALLHSSRVLGAAPLCRDARLARLFADLPVFVRQSHAERDLAALGESLVTPAPPGEGQAPSDMGAAWSM